MKSNFRRWLPAITAKKNYVAGLAALAIATGVAGGVASAALATPEAGHAAASHHAAAPITVLAASAPAGSATSAAKPVAAPAPAPAAPAAKPAAKELNHSFELQSNFYYCGPSATRVALSAHGKVFTQDQTAKMLGTTEDGTPSAKDVTRVMNDQLGQGRYHTVEISGQKATVQQVDQLKTDVVNAITQGDPVVANIAGTVTDTKGEVHSYEGGHYLPVVGYSDNGSTVKIADSADKVGSPYYDVTAKTLANWIATRGYAA